jgi:hypothetical protein
LHRGPTRSRPRGPRPGYSRKPGERQQRASDPRHLLFRVDVPPWPPARGSGQARA